MELELAKFILILPLLPPPGLVCAGPLGGGGGGTPPRLLGLVLYAVTAAPVVLLLGLVVLPPIGLFCSVTVLGLALPLGPAMRGGYALRDCGCCVGYLPLDMLANGDGAESVLSPESERACALGKKTGGFVAVGVVGVGEKEPGGRGGRGGGSIKTGVSELERVSLRFAFEQS